MDQIEVVVEEQIDTVELTLAELALVGGGTYCAAEL